MHTCAAAELDGAGSDVERARQQEDVAVQLGQVLKSKLWKMLDTSDGQLRKKHHGGAEARWTGRCSMPVLNQPMPLQSARSLSSEADAGGGQVS